MGEDDAHPLLKGASKAYSQASQVAGQTYTQASTAAGQAFSQASVIAGHAFTHGSVAAEHAASATRDASVRVYEAAVHHYSNHRPWRETVDKFSRPADFVDATSRIRKNTSYFFSNYVSLLAIYFIFALLLEWKSLVWFIVLSSTWLYLFVVRPPEEPLVVMGNALSSVDLAWIFGVITILVCLSTSVGSLIVHTLLLWLLLVVVHASLREPDESYVDDGSHPFLVWLGNPGPSRHYAPVAPATSGPGRV